MGPRPDASDCRPITGVDATESGSSWRSPARPERPGTRKRAAASPTAKTPKAVRREKAVLNMSGVQDSNVLWGRPAAAKEFLELQHAIETAAQTRESAHFAN